MIANEAFEPARSARSAEVHVGADCCKRIDKTTKTPLKGVLSCLLHVHAHSHCMGCGVSACTFARV